MLLHPEYLALAGVMIWLGVFFWSAFDALRS
jgi:hypothetical protein